MVRENWKLKTSMKREPLILAVDTSCDDTSVAVVRGKTIISNVIASQVELHKPYGGVFPTVAKQAHKENIKPTVELALKRAQTKLEQIDALAVTAGPGLAPALEVGIRYIKKIAEETGKPIIAVNHIEGHALSAIAQRNSRSKSGATSNNQKSKQLASDKIQFPVLSIIVSGGHTEFVLFNQIRRYEIIGSTIDDAAGECLDKIGRMLNLGYPAGPTIEKFSKLGDPKKVEFPLPMTTIKNFDMSFSGLKTFARNYLEANFGKASLKKQDVYNFCASAQYGVFRHIIYKLNKVLERYEIKEIWLGGGVAANTQLRKMIRSAIKESTKTTSQKHTKKIKFRTPYTNKLCMDNAAMIGLVASYKFKRKEFVKDPSALDRKPRWRINQKQ